MHTFSQERRHQQTSKMSVCLFWSIFSYLCWSWECLLKNFLFCLLGVCTMMRCCCPSCVSPKSLLVALLPLLSLLTPLFQLCPWQLFFSLPPLAAPHDNGHVLLCTVRRADGRVLHCAFLSLVDLTVMYDPFSANDHTSHSCRLGPPWTHLLSSNTLSAIRKDGHEFLKPFLFFIGH